MPMPIRAWPAGASIALGLAAGGLVLLAAASAPLAAQEPPAGAQGGEPADAQALIDRVREIEGAPAPEMTEQEVRTLLRDSLGVEILRVEVIEHAGEPAYAVTVMTPPGNRNNALMATTLLVDGATGALLGERSTVPRTAAPDLPTATGRQVPESGGQDIRRRTWR